MTDSSRRRERPGLATGPTTTGEVRRLGKDGSYRLGQLRAQGIGGYERPAPFRPHFVRTDHRWPESTWLLGLAAGSLLIAIGAAVGWWFVPFAAGVVAGLANRVGAWRLRVALPAVAVMAGVGWVVPLGFMLIRAGQAGGVPRLLSATLGLPRHAVVGIALTVLVAMAQAIAGYWVGRAFTPHPTADPPLTPAADLSVTPARDSSITPR
jgi:hypothetical protein